MRKSFSSWRFLNNIKFGSCKCGFLDNFLHGFFATITNAERLKGGIKKICVPMTMCRVETELVENTNLSGETDDFILKKVRKKTLELYFLN